MLYRTVRIVKPLLEFSIKVHDLVLCVKCFWGVPVQRAWFGSVLLGSVTLGDFYGTIFTQSEFKFYFLGLWNNHAGTNQIQHLVLVRIKPDCCLWLLGFFSLSFWQHFCYFCVCTVLQKRSVSVSEEDQFCEVVLCRIIDIVHNLKLFISFFFIIIIISCLLMPIDFISLNCSMLREKCCKLLHCIIETWHLSHHLSTGMQIMFFRFVFCTHVHQIES